MITMPCDQRYFILLAAAAACAVCVMPAPAWAASISSTDFIDLAARCAPSVPVETLAAVARTESGVDPWALHDNTTGASIRPDSLNESLTKAEQLINRGDSVDLGLMQINSANLSALGINVADALDACDSLAGGADVLRAAYGGGNTRADQQVALLLALSRYNTGTPFKGIMNGYARTVMANAPAGALSPSKLDIASSAQPIDPNAPPAWNIWATATYAQTHGAAWMVSVSPNTGILACQKPPNCERPRPTARRPVALRLKSVDFETHRVPRKRSIEWGHSQVVSLKNTPTVATYPTRKTASKT